jgi:poly-beta-1,6-N-acetyl-D-glucosamine biosynthesis protein PgaD
MKPNDPGSWPPIISIARAPLLVRLRDYVLTVAAWALLIYLARNGIALIIDYFSYPIFQLTKTHPPGLPEVWDHLGGFLIYSIAAMVWVTMWGIINRHQLRYVARVTPPSPLPVEQHAAGFNLDVKTVELWREMKVVVVQFDPNHRIIDAKEVSPDRAALDSSSS